MMQSSKLLKRFKSIFSDKSGNVAMIFGLSVIPILAVAGFAIDFQMTTMRKAKVQVVVDSAVLAGARAMQANKTEAQIRVVVKSYMTAQIGTVGSNLNCNEPDVVFVEGSQDIQASIYCEQDTSLMQIIGKDVMPFKVSSTSTWGIGKLDVAFMFDVSGSMRSSSRMTYLKAAAQEAVDTLLPEGGGVGTEEVRISMITYDTAVNAGDYFEAVTGLAADRTYYAEYEEEYTVEVEYEDTCRVRVEEEVEDTRTRCRWQDSDRCRRRNRHGRCTRYYRERVCEDITFTRIERRWEDQTCMRTRNEVRTRTATTSQRVNNTCVYERPGDHAFRDTAPTLITPLEDIYGADSIIYHAGMAGRAPGASAIEDASNVGNYLAAGYAIFTPDEDDADGGDWDIFGTSCNRHEPLGLTNSRSSLTNYINALTTNGWTAGQQGIAWAWYTVAQPWNTVFTGTSTPLDYTEPDSVKAIILMTDGAFNRAEFPSELGNSDTQARAMCDAVKRNSHVIVYTVAFQAPSSGRSVLSYCASGPEFSFAPNNGEELSQAYQAIATSISDLRVKF